ncbi:MAG: response regulator [Candidatus Saganbacteria bacterium]|nr:response regulator [Candidatus Saganbacteria bacterium]
MTNLRQAQIKETKRILVVDDEQGILDFFEKALNREGYDVRTSLDGSDALEKLKMEKPDLVILDIKMPGIDGIETLHYIREMDKNVVVLMLTAYGTLDSAKEALRLGATDYITKPFKLDYIKEVVKENLGL